MQIYIYRPNPLKGLSDAMSDIPDWVDDPMPKYETAEQFFNKHFPSFDDDRGPGDLDPGEEQF